MDALIYTVMSGAERVQRAQQVHANNLANLETAGFRADLEQAGAAAVAGHGYDARHLSLLQTDRVSSREGAVRETGRELDVAIVGAGLIAVQHGEGEAYTRAGSFTLDGQGRLLLGGRPVLGEGGPVVLPPHHKVEIADDGSIAVLAAGSAELQPVDRLKLVRPSFTALAKNEAGLLVARDGLPLEADPGVRVAAGRLEASNVSAVEEMVASMNLARDYELQMRLFKAADGMAETGNRLLRD